MTVDTKKGIETMKERGEKMTQRFSLSIYEGTKRAARIHYDIETDAILGEVTFSTANPLLRRALREFAWHPQRWPDLVEGLRSIMLSTGGRFMPRFEDSPVRDGRDKDRVLQKMMVRVIV